MGSNPATPTVSPRDHHRRSRPAGAITARGDERVEEHRRDPEPDPGAARHRGAVRRAEAEPRQGVPGDRRAGPRARASGRARCRARIIDQRVGRAAVLEEAVQDAHPGAYSDGRARARGAQTLGQPEIEITELDDGEPLAFTAEVDVRPEIDAAGARPASTVTVDDVEVADEPTIDEQVDGLRERFATLKAVERPAQDGDFVPIDLAATVDGEEVPGGSATDLSHEVGSDAAPARASTRRSSAHVGGRVRRRSPPTLVAGDFAGRDGRRHGHRPLGQGEGAARARRRLRPAGQRVRHARRAARRPARAAQPGEDASSRAAQARDKVLERAGRGRRRAAAGVAGARRGRVPQARHRRTSSSTPALDLDDYLAVRGQDRGGVRRRAAGAAAESAVQTQLMLDAIADAGGGQRVRRRADRAQIVHQAAARRGGPAGVRRAARRRAGNLPASGRATCAAARRWPPCWSGRTITDASGRTVDLDAPAAAAGRRTSARGRGGRASRPPNSRRRLRPRSGRPRSIRPIGSLTRAACAVSEHPPGGPDRVRRCELGSTSDCSSTTRQEQP